MASGLKPMETYQVETVSFSAEIIVDHSGRVIQAGPDLNWAVGNEWEHVKIILAKNHWPVVKVIDPHTIHSENLLFEDDEIEYRIRIRNGVIVKITQTVDHESAEDISFDSLPDDLKGLL